MSHKARAFFHFLTIVSVLVISAVGTTSVYADDGAPPPIETEETVPPIEGGEPPAAEPTEAAPTEASVVTEPTEGAPTEEPVVTEPPAEAAPTGEAPVVEDQPPAEQEPEAVSILEQVPADTTVTVLNAEGEAQSLTTQASANAIIEGDPIWCPASVTVPTPGANGCTTSKANFTELLSFLKANESNPAYQQSGTIFVEMGDYAGNEPSIDFNAYQFQYINNYNLTVTGGWNTTNNSTVDTTQFKVPVVIGTSTNPWFGSLSINNINITGVSKQTGLTLFSLESIVLDHVQVSGSQAGADLNAGEDVTVRNSKFNSNKKFGARINTTFGSVDVKDSDFNNNGSSKDDGFGLEIDNQGNVLLTNVDANENEKFGADIATRFGDVKIVNSLFNGNISYSGTCGNKAATGGYGLRVVTEGSVRLEDGTEASGNYLYGAHLEAGVQGAFVHDSSFNGKGLGSTNRTQKQGLEIVSDGMAEVVGVHADNNLRGGADVKATDTVIVNQSFFDGNKSSKCSCNGTTYYGYGLQVVTSGSLNMAEVSASGNNLVGAHLEGNGVFIYDGTFDNNNSGSSSTLTGKGLEIISTGNASLSSVSASNNQLFGADVRASGWVDIANSFFSGQAVYTHSCSGGNKLVGGGYGLQVVSTSDAVSLTGVEANNNYLYGAHLVGTSVAIAGGAVEPSSFNNNEEGLKIESTGIVELDTVKADNNRIAGATISTNGKVSIADSSFSGNLSYKSSSCSGKTFSGYGLQVTTAGNISMDDVIADKNYVYGASLKGKTILISDSSFSKNGTGVLSDHIGKGLEIVSTDSASLVELATVTADGNQLFGANIQAEGDVTIYADSSFSGNMSYKGTTCGCKTYDGYGVKVVTTSDIFFSQVTAEKNYLFGAHLEGANVDIGYSNFNLNVSPLQQGQTPTGRGLEVISTGYASLWNVEASNNQLFGADIQAGGEVEITASFFANNKYTYSSSCKGSKTAGYGLKIAATGPITLGLADDPTQGIQATENGAEGTIIEGKSTVNVYDSTFKNNGSTGLSITTGEDVTLDNVTATGNGSNGVYVKGDCTNTVFAFGGNFAYNNGYGIRIVDAAYTPDGAQVFAGNSSGTAYVTGCTTSGGGGCGSGGGHSGWGWWPWWSWYGGYYRH